MTLPELLIAVTITALLAGVLATSLIVTVRQQDNTEGRLNVARAEQNVSMWMPADLASADTVDTDPSATPCGAPTCDGIFLGDGSNVLMLEWSEVGVGDALCPPDGMSNCTVTRVSYNFYPDASGELYELRRVECVSTDLVIWSCTSHVVLRNLPGPPGGDPFVAGVGQGAADCAARLADPAQTQCTRPTWVIIVSEPLDPCAGLTGDEFTACVGDTEPGTTTKDANRVVVSINGGGDSEGAGGGDNQISITAGGTTRRTISADSMTGAPSFLEAHSRCGGPLTLVIDQSNSIPDYARSKVRTAAIEFARVLQGTPVQIQVVEFDTRANVLGDGQSIHPEAGWHEYFDMTESADWTKLESLLAGMAFGGGTNWEDALFHTFYNADGTMPQIVPETVVFFTDGVPTYSRQSYREEPSASPAAPIYDGALWQTFSSNDTSRLNESSLWTNGETGGHYSQSAFKRADAIAAAVRAEQAGYVRMIGVGVGGVSSDVVWVSEPGYGYINVWEHAYGRYQQGSPGFWSNLDFEQATTFQANLDYERASRFQANLDYERRKSNGMWENTSPEAYYANNTNSTESDGWRIKNGTDVRSWYDIDESVYDSYRTQSPANFRIDEWTNTDPATFYTSQPANPTKWRINGERTWYSISETAFDAWRTQSPSNFSGQGWTDRTPTQYYAGQPAAPAKWRINSPNRAWYQVTEAEYNAHHGSDTSVNWKPEQTWAWVSKAVYDAGVITNPTGFREVAKTSLPTTTPGAEFEIVSAQGSPSSHYRQAQVRPATGPYSGIAERIATPKPGTKVLARLIAADDTGTPYQENVDPDGTDNSEIANMFVIPGNDEAAWSKLVPAMKAIALGECGGTLTLATKTSAGTSVAAPFTYENSAVFRSDGTAVSPFEPNVVTTNVQARTRGFDYVVPGGTYITTEIRPQASSVLLRFEPVGWECRAGARVLSPAEINEQPIDLVVTNPDGSTSSVPSGWTKIAVQIRANEAVSCTLRVVET